MQAFFNNLNKITFIYVGAFSLNSMNNDIEFFIFGAFSLHRKYKKKLDSR